MDDEASETPVERMGNSNVDEVQEAREQKAAACLQRMFRCRNARLRLRLMLASVFEKFYDADSGLFYYLDKRTGETTWEKPRALRGDDDIELTAVYDGKEEATSDAEPTGETGAALQVVDLDKDDNKSGNEEGEKGEEEERDEEDGDKYLGYSAQELELAREQFAHFDTDSSGSINANELLQLFTNLGEQLTLKNVQGLIKAVDTDGNGEVDFDEFLHLLRKQQDKNQYSASLTLALLFGPKELTKLKQQFMVLDLDGSGDIDEHELQQLVKKLGRRAEEFDLPAMLREVDADGSGSIGFNEFLQIVATMTESDGSSPKSAFAALLDLGIAQGLLNGLDEVVQASRQKVFEWLNADLIAERKRLQLKRERRRHQEEERQHQLAKDRELYATRQAELAVIERARHAQIEGLAIEVEFEGDGRNFPAAGQFARVHYVASFERTGEIFESTRARCGSALEFCVGAGHTIQGFELALQRMSVGETARVTIAPALAYGVKGRPPRIPPNAALVFRIELISIKEKLQSPIEVAPITPVQRVRNR
ncbi:Allograft inflammatory factor 1-like [Phytophthora pseudosyringae]|uniref:peptidylprolyl isomerase n=1 Tax=Phytophthora pseudosyringae TaxID=221518 RepID=A0A8T1VTC1_9STRA|nr:Allograft inflammatory factor 1-like [Phytophthora pseudosyringae]